MNVYLVIFAAVLGLNVIPFFAPATWTVLTFITIRYNIPLLPLALVGAVAATLGRLTLAKLSRVIVREKFLSEKTKKNIDEIKIHLEKRKALTFGLFLFYAFSPLPSNQLFIAYGLTNMSIFRVALPFFLGRIVSYTVLSFSVSKAALYFFPDSLTRAFGGYFLIVQVLTIFSVYIFTKIKWHELFAKRKVEILHN